MSQPRKRSARGSGEDLRAEILIAARTLLIETGSVDAVSIRAIGRVVGVSAPSIYRHFADKNVLIEAVLQSVFGDLESALAVAVADDDSPLEQLVSYGKAYVKFACDRPEHYRVGMMMIAGAATDLDHTLAHGAFVRLVDHVTDCMTAGYFPAGDPVQPAMDAWAVAHGVAALQITKPFLPWGDRDAVIDRVLRATLVGYCLIGRDADEPLPPDVLTWIHGHR